MADVKVRFGELDMQTKVALLVKQQKRAAYKLPLILYIQQLVSVHNGLQKGDKRKES